ncbi:two-partner secretion domain-containing protein [Pseudomonas sp. ICMP 561]|uniref:two-partner secretion domain-containing protein n=1 Tax=Pseudomonas sp. ICMP 561 TaxID=1718918 RepID=UPI000C086875|nr:DUF637 domain-containing protein [Pseudomonas sp. ICMP 561]PHN26482.1 hypothetical protein AO242_26675 [Pseudomonas sp. ICMP 561]
MDVKQLAFLARQPSAALNSRESFWGMPKRGIALILANAMFWQPLMVQAEGIAVSGGGTSLTTAGNGVQVINIAKPNGTGLSHNTFDQYNVGSQGVILNNATSQTLSTQLGGIIIGNSNLQGTAATTILNEVTGNNRTQLKGYTEVAGQAARVIIANPYGITCNGCGFINTPQATLTTGKPVLDQGRLDHFQVDGGDISLEGAGLNASNIEQFDLITRSATLNAKLYAKKLNVVTGRNKVDAKTLDATALADDGSVKPELAIDSSALGGMYAGSIKLVGTEQGVGVRLNGELAASAGDIQLDANGNLRMAQASANGVVKVKADSLDMQGVVSGNSVDLQTTQALNVQQNIVARDKVTLTSGGQLTNNAVIESGVDADNSRNTTGDISLTAKDLRNVGSVVASRDLKVKTTQDLNNDAGTLASNAALELEVDGLLSNQNDGLIYSRNANTKIKAGSLDNSKGTLLAAQGLDVNVTGDIANRNGRVIARDGVLSVKAANLNNAGQLTGKSVDLAVTNALNNRDGSIESDTTLTVSAASVDNQNGTLRAVGTSGLTRFSIGGAFDNSDGTVETANNALELSVGSLINTGGSVLHIGRGDFGLSTRTVMRAGGSLVTHGDLTLNADSWINSSVIQAGRLIVNVDHFNQTADGQLLASTELQGSGVDWTNNGLIASDGDLMIDLSGEYAGAGQATSQGDLWLDAGSLKLAEAGRITGGGTTDVYVSGALNNAGRISASQDLLINAGSLENRGTLSAAEYVTINTGELLNEGGLIFSGADMELRGTKVTNRFGDIYSMGDLTIAKNAAGDRAQVIENISGTLESAGDMSLSADAVTNRKDVLTLANKRVNAYITHSCAHCSDEWNVWYYVNEIYERTVTEDSASAFMTIGGNLTVTGTSFLNQYSSVSAVKDIDITVDDFKNEGTTLATITYRAHYRNPADQEPGSIYLGLIDPGGAVNEFNKYSAKYVPLYRRADGSYFYQQESGLSTTLNPDYDPTKNMPVPTAVTRYGVFSATQVTTPGKSIDAVIQSGGDTTIVADDEFNNSIQKVSAPIVTSDSQVDASGTLQATTPFIAQLNTQLPADLAQQQVDPLTLPGFVIPDSDNGLFRLSSGPTSQNIPDANGQVTPHKYLIETNSALTDLKQFMSSDYLLDKLGYDPALSAKRLGDGLYEQRLIQQAIVARTGQRFIDGQTSDEAQFKYLMNNAAASKDALNLSVGVTLTAEQVAALTDDIVWMEEREVQGEKVLVPVLYLAQADNRLAPTGALIAGNNVSLTSGANLENAGTLRASNNLSALSGKDLINSGLMQANARLDALATNNIANQAGGIIKGNDVSITSLFGSVLNERTVTTYAGSNTSGKGNWNWSQDFVDNAARIEAGNTLGINAAGDFTSVGSVLSSGADMKIDAGGSVNILSTQQNNRIADGESHDDSTIRQHASQVIAGGALTVNADNDITAVASQIEAKTDVTLTAGKNLTLASAADEDHTYTKGSSITRQEDHVRQVAATVKAGGDVKLSATEDLTMIASRIAAGDEASLIAGKDLNILAAQNSDYTLFDMKKEGGFGSKETQRDEVTQITHVGSEITTGGNLTLKSTGDQLYQAAKLDSGKDLTIDSGGAITFEGVKDLHQESHEKSKNSLAWTSMSGKGNTDETLRQTQMIAKGELAIRAVDGLKIDIKEVNKQTVSQTIDAMVKADPQLAWLKEAENRGDVDWQLIKETHDAYKYSHSSLGQGAMLAIIIIVTIVTAGTGTAATVGVAASDAMVAAGFAGAATAASAAAVASFSAAVAQAAVSVVNNKGDLGAAFKDVTSADAMKGYLISGLAAGFAAGVLDKSFGVKTADLSKATHGFELGTMDGFTKFAGYTAAQGGFNAVANTAINGGSLKDNLAQVAISSAADVLTAGIYNKLGSQLVFSGLTAKVGAHALVGGLIAELAGGDFRTGALAAGANEAFVASVGDKIFAENSRDQLLAMTSQLIGLTVAAAAGGSDKDQAVASWVASQATKFNSLDHPTAERLLDQLKACSANRCSADEQRNLIAKFEKISADRSALLAACPTAECRENIRANTIAMDDPVAQELVAWYRERVSYDMVGLLTGDPSKIAMPAQGYDPWGAKYVTDDQIILALNIQQNTLTPAQQAYLDSWNKETGWMDRAVGRVLTVAEKAEMLVSLGNAMLTEGWGKASSGNSASGNGVVQGGTGAGPKVTVGPAKVEQAPSFSNQFPDHAIGAPTLISDTKLTQGAGKYNYVVLEGGELLVGRRSKDVGGGHIDLANGKPVIAAGEVKILNGKVKYIDNTSGHYEPSGPAAQAAAEKAFSQKGLDVNGTYIEKIWLPNPSKPSSGAWVPKK